MSAIARTPRTRGTVAYEAVRKMIAAGELAPGQWLRQRDLAKKLGMSSTPLIEALRRLEQEGIVESFPQWGSRVRVVTCDDLEQFLLMRQALERVIAQRLIVRNGAVREKIKSMYPLARQIDGELQAATAAGEPPYARTREADCEFHRQLGYLADAPLLVSEIDRLRLMALTTSLVLHDEMPRTATHVHILEAVLKGNLRQAEKVFTEHFAHKLNCMLPQLRKQFGSGPVLLHSSSGAAGSTYSSAVPVLQET